MQLAVLLSYARGLLSESISFSLSHAGTALCLGRAGHMLQSVHGAVTRRLPDSN